MDVSKIDRNYLVRDEPADNIQIVASKGNYLIDVNGKKYLDFYMGWCVGNIGWGNKEIQQRIKRFKGPDYLTPTFLYKPWAELAALLAKITPGKLSKSFRATGGTEAVEIALRLANAYTGKHKFISIEGSYHGNSIAATSIGCSSYKKYHPGLLFESYKIKPPLNDAAAEQVEKLLKQKDVAALIMEPIICNMGVLIPEKNFMQRIQSLCKQYEALLIMDEVATGFGRTGEMFACEHFGINPDIMCLAKAITGGYAGMGATLTTDAVAKAVKYQSSYYSTYGWHPLSVEAAIENIHYHLKHKKEIAQNTKTMSQYFYKRLSSMRFKYPPEIRIIGLAICVKFNTSNYSSHIVETAKQKGLLLSTSTKAFTLFPALNIDLRTAQQGLDILELCI